MTVWFHKPATHGNESYNRETYPAIAAGAFAVELRSTTAITPGNAALIDPAGAAMSVPLVSKPMVGLVFVYGASFTTTALADGSYILDAPSHAVVKVPVNVCNGPAPSLSAPRKVAIASANMVQDVPATGHTYAFVDYPIVPRSFPMPIRNATPWPDRWTNPEAEWADGYVQLMSRAYGVKTLRREFNVLQNGHVCVAPWQRYQIPYFDDLKGDDRDGPRGLAGLGSPVAARIRANGDAVVLSSSGSLYHLSLTGERTTIIGRTLQPTDLAPRSPEFGSEAWFPGWHTLFGNWQCPAGLSGPMDFALTADEATAYIVDSNNHRVLRVDIATAAVTRIGGMPMDPMMPGCMMGFADGEPDMAMFDHPMGCELSLDGSALYVGDDHNCAIRRYTFATGLWDTPARCANAPTMGQLPATINDANLDLMRAQWSLSGPIGQAKFLHCGQMRFMSDGRLVVQIHHTFEIWVFDLVAGRADRLVTVPVSITTTNRMKAWGALAVDRWGALGGVDDIFAAGWGAGMEHRFDKNGVRLPNYMAASPPKYPRSNQGPWDTVNAAGYPWLPAIDPRGALWAGDAATGTMQRITRRRPTDEAPPLRLDFERGEELWKSAQPDGKPPFALFYGTDGYSQLGYPLIDEIGAMTPAALDAQLGLTRYPAADANALRAYVRGLSTAARMLPDSEDDPIVNAQLQKIINQLTADLVAMTTKYNDCEAECAALKVKIANAQAALANAQTALA